MNLHEAFRALDALNEDTFSFSNDEENVNEASAFILAIFSYFKFSTEFLPLLFISPHPVSVVTNSSDFNRLLFFILITPQ